MFYSGAAAWAFCSVVFAEALRPARPPKEKLLFGQRNAVELAEGRRIILDEDSYPREQATIVEGPTVARKDEGYVIRFALDKPDDVLVRIVDGKGNTVRDLVSGVLGWNTFVAKHKWAKMTMKTDVDPVHRRFPFRITADGKGYILDGTCQKAWYPHSNWKEGEAIGVMRVTGDFKSQMRLMPVQLDPFWFLDYTGKDTSHWTMGADGFVYVVRGDPRMRICRIWKVAVNPLKAAADFEYNGTEKLDEMFPWARFRKTKGAVKMHTLLNLQGSIPEFIHISDGKLGDVNVLDILILEPGSFYIMDRGYIDFARLYAMHQSLFQDAVTRRADMRAAPRLRRETDSSGDFLKLHDRQMLSLAEERNE